MLLAREQQITHLAHSCRERFPPTRLWPMQDHEHEAHEDLLELDVRVSQEVSAGWAQVDVAASSTNRGIG